MSESNLEIIELYKRNFDKQDFSKLILQMRGSSVNNFVVNCLRRTAFKNIPTYAICEESITIEFNDSVFNNDYMRLRLAQLPLFNISNDIEFLQRKYWHEVDYSDNKRDKNPDDDKHIELYLNAHNDTASNIDVFSNSIKYYKDGNKIDDLLSKIDPVLIVQLRPNQTFKMKARAVLGVGERSDIWSSVSTMFYEEVKNDNFKLTIESQGQFDEYVILIKSCKIIKKKLEDIKKLVEENFKHHKIKKDELIEIVLTNEDHTVGNIINNGLQSHPKIIYSGLSKPDLLIEEIIIKLNSIDELPLKPFFDVIKENVHIFDIIEKQLTKVGKKYIKD